MAAAIGPHFDGLKPRAACAGDKRATRARGGLDGCRERRGWRREACRGLEPYEQSSRPTLGWQRQRRKDAQTKNHSP
jgi:hypothetical protein